MLRASIIASLALLLVSQSIPSAAAPRRRPARTNLKYPVILLHGFNASPKGKTGFSREVQRALLPGTTRIIVPQLNPSSCAPANSSR